jgi:hypothetical protein
MQKQIKYYFLLFLFWLLNLLGYAQIPDNYYSDAYSKIESMLSGNDSLDFKECGSLNLKIK